MANFDGDSWTERAACRGSNVDFFDEGSVDAALALCAICPAVAPCRRMGLAEAASDGVWGGLTPAQRRREARRLAIRSRQVSTSEA